MKNSLKIFSLLFIIHLAVACGGVQNDEPTNTASDNTDNAVDTVDFKQDPPAVTENTEDSTGNLPMAMQRYSTTVNIPMKQKVAVEASPLQRYSSMVNANEEEVEQTWQQYFGTKKGSELGSQSELNDFIQFVRKTGGEEFASHNKQAAELNYRAHEIVYDLMFPKEAELRSFLKTIEQQRAEVQWMRDRIVKAAEIYEVPLQSVDQDASDYRNYLEAYSQPLLDILEVRYQHYSTDTFSRRDRAEFLNDMQDLLQTSLLVVKDGAEPQYFSFLGYTLVKDKDALTDAGKLVLKERVYGLLRLSKDGETLNDLVKFNANL